MGDPLAPVEVVPMDDVEGTLPESQLDRAEWLADELMDCGHDDIRGMDILDALASIGMKLVPDDEGLASREYLGVHKSAARSAKADQN